MKLDIADDRLAQLLMGSDHALGFDDARLRLERATLVISADDTAAKSLWGQAALLTIAECAVRMFKGGAYLASELTHPVIVGNNRPIPLYRLLENAGCQPKGRVAPPHAFALHVGSGIGPLGALRCWADGWVATVSPHGPTAIPLEGNEISGALTGAMAISEIFRKIVLNDIRAGKRTQRLSPLTPANPDPAGITLKRYPSCFRLLGLGNLGQATLWVLGLLPYADPNGVEILLQDFDISGPENLDTQILTKYSWIGRKKARSMANWAEDKGFSTVIAEQLFTSQTRRAPHESGLAFIGVDNLEARRCAATAGFDLVLDAGLGGTATEVFDIRIHAFPGFRSAEEAWPEISTTDTKPIPPALTALIKEGRLENCGALTIANQNVGVPCTAIVAATIQIAQACRALAEGTYCDLVDVRLQDTRHARVHEAFTEKADLIPFQRARGHFLY